MFDAIFTINPNTPIKQEPLDAIQRRFQKSP